MDYYSKMHTPVVGDLFGKLLKSYSIDQDIHGRTPEEPKPYATIKCFYFDELYYYKKGFGPHAQKF
ncbi:MAG: EthD family reductase [Bacteroidota bacterium]